MGPPFLHLSSLHWDQFDAVPAHPPEQDRVSPCRFTSPRSPSAAKARRAFAAGWKAKGKKRGDDREAIKRELDVKEARAAMQRGRR